MLLETTCQDRPLLMWMTLGTHQLCQILLALAFRNIGKCCCRLVSLDSNFEIVRSPDFMMLCHFTQKVSSLNYSSYFWQWPLGQAPIDVDDLGDTSSIILDTFAYSLGEMILQDAQDRPQLMWMTLGTHQLLQILLAIAFRIGPY